MVSSMVSPWREVLDLPVGFPVADQAFGDQFLAGLMELGGAEAQNRGDGPIRIETSPLAVSDHHQKQVEGHRFMA
jgi:hypothetical protein